MLEELKDSTKSTTNFVTLEKLLNFAFGINSVDQTTTFSDFPTGSLKYVAKIFGNNPHLPIWEGIHRLYPYKNLMEKENRQNVENLLKSLDISIPKTNYVQEILEVREAENPLGKVKTKQGKKKMSQIVKLTSKQNLFFKKKTNWKSLST